MSAVDAFALPAALCRRLAMVGIEAALLLREAGLPPTLLPLIERGQARVNTAGFFALWQALDRLDPDPAFGLRLVGEATRDMMDVASMAALHAASVGDALATLARYKRLVCPEELQVTPHGGETAVAFRWLLAEEPPPARLIDACFAAVLFVARAGTGAPLSPLRVAFARRERDRPVFEAFFGCPVQFDAAADHMVFADEALALPFRTANADVLAMLLPGLEAALATLHDDAPEDPFIEQVRAEIRRQMQGRRALVDSVASSLALSARSLQRRLSDNGTSFQRILDEVRHRVARELLGTTTLDHGEIAFLLGFEELNSFNRAFAGWEGVSPLRWRRGLQQAGGPLRLVPSARAVTPVLNPAASKKATP